MTRLKAWLDRRLARMSDAAKFDLELVVTGVMGLAGGMAGALVILAVLGYLVGFWWWWLTIPGAALCLAATVALWRLADYVGRDVLHAWYWDWW